MKLFSTLLFIIFSLIILQGCNTLYNTHAINIEIIEPAEIQLHPNIKKIAVKYNNCNINYNPKYAKYYKRHNTLSDPINTDSIAAEVYFRVFLESLNEQNYFDSIIELQAYNYTGIKFDDSLITQYDFNADSILVSQEDHSKLSVYIFNELLKQDSIDGKNFTKTKIMNPEFGLYSQKEIEHIASSTNADLLFSFDYFSSVDRIDFIKPNFGIESVYTTTCWNIYDLKEKNLSHFEFKIDTVSWDVSALYLNDAIKKLPPRKDAILNAADISGIRLAHYLVPHWIAVQRMYYKSGQLELKKTNQLIKENKWMEAIEIWKKNISNPNKKIMAKCMYNMGLACEMEGNIEAAIDWIVKSYYVFNNNNEIHAYNCKSYIKILSQRKADIKKLELQFN